MRTFVIQVFLLLTLCVLVDCWGSRSRLRVRARANVRLSGSVGVDAGRKKRNVEWNGDHYIITIQANPCIFGTYDDDRDGEIDEGEMNMIFGHHNTTRDFFNALDKSDDGVVREEEFYEMIPLTVKKCSNLGEK